MSILGSVQPMVRLPDFLSGNAGSSPARFIWAIRLMVNCLIVDQVSPVRFRHSPCLTRKKTT